VIANEDDVRTYVRKTANGKVRWVEPALGSTSGLPDCWVPWGSYCVHIELKCGEIKQGVLCYTVRPEQKRELRLMRTDGVPCGLLIGVQGTDTMVVALPTTEALSGRLELKNMGESWVSVAPGDPAEWRRLVYFIFLNSTKSRRDKDQLKQMSGKSLENVGP
jgi:hypothetical protein